MARFDDIGLFWKDVRVDRKRGAVVRPMPPIPETGWRPPTAFPNLSAARVLSIDVEAYDPELQDYGPFWARGRGNVCGFSVGADGGGRWYFPIRHTVEPEMNMDPGHCLAWLKDTLADPRQPKVGANLLYDIGALKSEGISVAGELVDVQFAEALLDERARVSLETLAQKYLGEGKVSGVLQQWIMDYYAPPKDQWRREIYRSPPRLVGPYGEGDADLPIRLAPILYERLQAEGLLDLFRMECDLIRLLVEMRYAGVSVDLKAAEQLRDQLVIEAKTEQAKLDALVGFHLEINSARSLAKAFDALGVKYPRTTPSAMHQTGQPSFTKAWLEKQANPVAEGTNNIRKILKLKTTFLESYILDSNVGGKIFCSFHPLRGDEGGTRSGRLSSSNPNLQNIPIRSDIGKIIRRAFVPDPGHLTWRKYDYSQIEYRFLVHFAIGPGSDAARAKFCADPDTDYHVWTQELVQRVLGRTIERKPIKNLNFGIVYGMGEDKLRLDLNLKSEKEAKEFLAKYHAGVPFAKPTIQATMKEAQELGVITTILGRKSRFDLWEPAKYGQELPALPFEDAIRRYGNIKRAYCHKALNRRLQGSAADLIKVAMWRCWKEGVFAETGVPRLTVHDELDFSDPGGKDEAFKEMHRILETAIPLRVPVRAGCDVGPNWGDTKPV